MGFRINTNIPSISAQRTLGRNRKISQDVLTKLSSGSRINKAADDAAGLAISEKLKAQVRSVRQANRNANDGVSLIQVAEGGLNEVSSILIRLRELSMQSATDTLTDSERQFLGLEYENLKQEVERISNSTEFNGKKLLNGATDSYDFQIGINNRPEEDRINYRSEVVNSTIDNLGINSINVFSKEDAREGLSTIDEAIQKVSGQRAELGAVQNRLQSTVNNLEVLHENLSAANSRIRDTDYAAETANNAKMNILTSAGTSVLGQANMATSAALKLIG